MKKLFFKKWEVLKRCRYECRKDHEWQLNQCNLIQNTCPYFLIISTKEIHSWERLNLNKYELSSIEMLLFERFLDSSFPSQLDYVN